MSDLDKKVKSSIRLIKTLDGLEPELAYSGGKDSDVILTLAQMSGIKFHPIYKMTTIDPPGTLAHVKSKGVEIRKPKMTFFEIVRYAGMPNSGYRICCSYRKNTRFSTRQYSVLGLTKATKGKKDTKNHLNAGYIVKKSVLSNSFQYSNGLMMM